MYLSNIIKVVYYKLIIPRALSLFRCFFFFFKHFLCCSGGRRFVCCLFVNVVILLPHAVLMAIRVACLLIFPPFADRFDMLAHKSFHVMTCTSRYYYYFIYYFHSNELQVAMYTIHCIVITMMIMMMTMVWCYDWHWWNIGYPILFLLCIYFLTWLLVTVASVCQHSSHIDWCNRRCSDSKLLQLKTDKHRIKKRKTEDWFVCAVFFFHFESIVLTEQESSK